MKIREHPSAFNFDERPDALDGLQVVLWTEADATSERGEVNGSAFLAMRSSSSACLSAFSSNFTSSPSKNLGLVGPLVSLDTPGEELNCFVHLFFQLRIHVSDLPIGRDAQRIQLLFDERPNALEDLQVVLGSDD